MRSSPPPPDRPRSSAGAARPLFNVDPGWLFILAGLALCVAGVLIPAQRDLFRLRSQLDALGERERMGSERLRLHAQFLADLDENDPSLTRRLAASQLNVVPAGDVPVILASSNDATLTDWIDARARSRSDATLQRAASAEWPDTTLTMLATGPQRLWLLGGGVLAVFVGLMLAPSRAPARSARAANAEVVHHPSDMKETAMNRTPFLETSLRAQSALAARATAEVQCITCEGPAEAADSFEYESPGALPADAEDDLVCEIITASEFAIDADKAVFEGATPDFARDEEVSGDGARSIADPRCAAD